MGWVAPSEYTEAKPDPLIDCKVAIMRHINVDRKDAQVLFAKRFTGIEVQDAEMTGVDRLGFYLRPKTKD